MVQSNDPTFRGTLTFDDLRKAIKAIKLQDPVKIVKTGSMKPLDSPQFKISRRELIGDIFGTPIMVDKSLKPDEYKLIFVSGKEETHKWTS